MQGHGTWLVICVTSTDVMLSTTRSCSVEREIKQESKCSNAVLLGYSQSAGHDWSELRNVQRRKKLVWL